LGSKHIGITTLTFHGHMTSWWCRMQIKRK